MNMPPNGGQPGQGGPEGQPWEQQPGAQPWGPPGQQPGQQWGPPGQPAQQPGGQEWGQPQQGQPQQGWAAPGQPQGFDPNQQWGQQPPGGFGQPGWGAPTPPKKSKAPLIAGIVAAVVLIAGGITAAVVLAGGDDEKDKDVDAKSSQSSDPTDEPTDGPTDEPTDEPTDDVPSDSQVISLGYSYSIPDGWMEATEDLKAEGAPETIDTVVVWGTQLSGSRANMIVETQDAGGATDPEELRETWVSTMESATGATAETDTGITVDDVDSIGIRFQRDNGSGTEIIQHAYLMISGDTAYAITLSYQPADESEVQEQFEEIIDSWDFS